MQLNVILTDFSKLHLWLQIGKLQTVFSQIDIFAIFFLSNCIFDFFLKKYSIFAKKLYELEYLWKKPIKILIT